MSSYTIDSHRRNHAQSIQHPKFAYFYRQTFTGLNVHLTNKTNESISNQTFKTNTFHLFTLFDKGDTVTHVYIMPFICVLPLFLFIIGLKKLAATKR